MVRWIEAGEKEGWPEGAIYGAWRYFPLDKLYPLTLGFFAGAALTTLVIMRRPKYRFIGALSLPILTVILVLAIFLGNEYRTLPAVLDSYWRPIHVTIATVGYGVCLVSFGLAFAHLRQIDLRHTEIDLHGVEGFEIHQVLAGIDIIPKRDEAEPRHAGESQGSRCADASANTRRARTRIASMLGWRT